MYAMVWHQQLLRHSTELKPTTAEPLQAIGLALYQIKFCHWFRCNFLYTCLLFLLQKHGSSVEAGRGEFWQRVPPRSFRTRRSRC
jgi:hypothetical protein